jgi:hypothetical protein
MVGKTRLALSPPVNHWWHVALYVSARGLTSSAMPIPGGGRLDVELDLLSHRLTARTSYGHLEHIQFAQGSVADFFAQYLDLLDYMGVHPDIYRKPVEGLEAIPFDEDTRTRPYNPEWATDFFGALLEADRLLQRFRGGFIGKATPVHFFWGGFDLASTRFSGRRAPRHPGGVPNVPDRVQVEAYSHECWSGGFWPGGGGYDQPAFYAYAYPEPRGFSEVKGLPEGAFYARQQGEFLLPYEAVRTSDDPDAAVFAFLRTTYESAADKAHWDRDELEADLEPSEGVSWDRTASISVGSNAPPSM